MSNQWGPGQAKKFAGQVELGKSYYVVRNQSAHAATYGAARLYDVHVFTHRSVLTGQPMTDGRTSALALCRNQGPVYDAPPRGASPMSGSRDRDRQSAGDFDKRARGLFG